MGTRDDADSAAGKSAVRARAEASAAAVLLELGGAFPVCTATAGVPDGAADLSDLWRNKSARDLAGDSGVCGAAPGDAVPDASADPGKASALVLERDLRDGAGTVCSAANDWCFLVAAAAKVQRDGQGAGALLELLRPADCKAVCADAVCQLCRAAVCDSAAASVCCVECAWVAGMAAERASPYV